MDGGRTAGESREGRGLVAGVKAAFRARPRGASKCRSGPHPQETTPPPLPQPPPTNSGQRSPRSPFLGWRKLKPKENSKGKENKENMRSEDVRVPEKSGQCSQSQALRLSHHSSGDYTLRLCKERLTATEELNSGNGRRAESHGHSKVAPSGWPAQKVACANVDAVKNDNSDSCQDTRLSPKCVSDGRVTEVRQDSDGGAEDVSSNSDSVSGHQEIETHLLRESKGENDLVVAGREGRGEACRSQNSGDEWKESKGEENAFLSHKCNTKDLVSSERAPWLHSALSYSLRVPEYPKNEVVVLALGVDQYVEEVFGFLDHAGAGKIDVEDFHALCRVLGLEDEEEVIKIQKCLCLGSTLTLLGSLSDSTFSGAATEASCPAHLSFREFRERLCEVFIRNANHQSLLSLGARRPANSSLVSSVVSVQRRYEILEAISRSLAEVNDRLKVEEERLREDNGPVCGKCQQVIHVDRNSNISPRPRDVEASQLQRQVLLQQQELQCLREVIDDLRVALQSSDAENLALQVQALKVRRWRQEVSLHDLSLTDEENTIDNLVKQLADLSPPPLGALTEHPETPSLDALGQRKEKPLSPKDNDKPTSPSDTLKTAFLSGDSSLEAELQATFEALQAAREEQEATQADLQQTVGQLQEREAELRKVEVNLQTSQKELGSAHHDNLCLVQEVAETRTSLEDCRCKLAQAVDDLQKAKDVALLREKQLEETQAKLDLLRDSRARVVARVGAARGLVAGSLGQVRAGEHALATLATHAAHTKLEVSGRVDSGLYSEDSERDEDTTSPDRSSERTSASEDDLWSPREGEASHPTPPFPLCLPPATPPLLTPPSEASPNSQPAATCATSREIIEGLERELEWLQRTLEEAERECDQEEHRKADDKTEEKKEKKAPVEEVKEGKTEKKSFVLLEEQMRQLLEVLVSLADMNLSRRTLGRLVLEAVEDASGLSINHLISGSNGEVPPLSLLTTLLTTLSSHASSKYHGVTTEGLFHRALHGLAHPPEARERVEATMG